MDKDYTLKPGVYIAENNDNYLDQYKILMRVKELEKTYTLQLIDFQSHYSAVHIRALFMDKKKVTIRKSNGGHAIRKWSEEDFTFYPYQAGIPYHFKLAEEKMTQD